MELKWDEDLWKWFKKWSGQFDWDSGNILKNIKHGISWKSIERIFDLGVYLAGEIVYNGTERRFLVFGELEQDQWALVVTVRNNKLRVISCRKQRSLEKVEYASYKKEDKNKIERNT